MFQRISLYWQLSELSPVSIANSSGSPVTGAREIALTARTIASPTWAVSISCGRYADAKRSVVCPVVFGSSYLSVHSTRAGDWWSTTCTSLSWAKASRLARVRDRVLFAATPTSVRTTRDSAGPVTTLR
jgi:hypothetical protein